MTQKQMLRAKARRLRSQMRKIASMMQGSVIYRQMKCGKPNCRCARGYPHFQSEQLSSGLLELVVGKKTPSLLPLIVDQTTMGDIQVITGSYPVEGRSIPLVMATFEYRELKASQNALEEDFLTKLSESTPKKTRVVWIMDRGYARASLLISCREQKWLYIIRGRSHVKVQYQERGKVEQMSLGRLKHRQGVGQITYCLITKS